MKWDEAFYWVVGAVTAASLIISVTIGVLEVTR